jgi:hypothetical protein
MFSHQSIIDAFSSLWDISAPAEGEITRDNPLKFSVKNGGPDSAKWDFCAWVYNRYNDVEVLRIDAEFGVVLACHADYVERWMVRENGRLPFATLRGRTTDQRDLIVSVTHTLLASEVTSDQLKEVIDSMYFMLDKCYELVSDLDPESDKDFEDFEQGYIESQQMPSEPKSRNPEVNFVAEVDVRIIGADNDDSVEKILSELNALIGLEPVKALVRQLAAQQQLAQHRRAHGMNAVLPSPHLVFMGNPGTGKTTVARLIGRLYKAYGLVSKGHVVEADRSSLVAGYIGQTAIKTREMCNEALGGVLFIDEAYSLNVDGRDYGTEAIEALLTFMEAHRGEFAVVVAGYPDKMIEFLQSNPGLKSRFDMNIYFPDYSTDELSKIFTDLISTHDYVLQPGALEKVYAHVDSWVRTEGFGNAREVRRFFQHVVGVQALALMGQSQLNTLVLREITPDMIPDIASPSAEMATTGSGYTFRNGYL